MKKKSILITGSGPTGLTMANLLTMMEIPFLLIDKNAHPSRGSKAFGIHARTLEIFDKLDIADRAISEGSIDNTLHIITRGKETAKFRLHEILPGESKYPYFLILQQDKTEKILIDSLKEKGQNVHWEHELTHLSNNSEGVMATIKGPSGDEKKTLFQYVIGCDGAGSTVRKLTGFSFKGKTFSSTFYLADCELDWKFKHGDIYFTVSPLYLSGIFSYPENNRFRIFNFMNTSVEKNEKAELLPEEVQKIIDSDPYLNVKAKNIDWTSVFRIHMRYTQHFQKGRIFLAGDAAHIHTPAAGQGMNTGIQDAYNLAWKISLVLKKQASLQLLKSYHEERHPIALNLHTTTDRLFQLMIQKKKLLDLFRFYFVPLIFRIIFGIKWLRKKNLRRFSQLAIKYRYSSINKEGVSDGFEKKAPKSGDRAPYCEISFNGKDTDIIQLCKCNRFTILITVSDPEKTEAYEIYEQIINNIRLPLNMYRISATSAESSFFYVYGIKKDAVFIVRPDGHIGYRSSRLQYDEIQEYFAKVLGNSR